MKQKPQQKNLKMINKEKNERGKLMVMKMEMMLLLLLLLLVVVMTVKKIQFNAVD